MNADGYINANGDLLGFNMYLYCGNNPVMGYDPEGAWNWNTFFNGANLLIIGAIAVATAATVLTCGAAAPAMVAIAAATAVAGAATAINGVAEIAEAATNYNFMRDGVYGGDESSYNTYRSATQAVAEVGTAICGAYYAANGGNVCFKEGTLILTQTGQIPIESVTAGMLVMATDPETGETALKPVVQLFRNETDEWIHLTVKGEEIVCTPEHPFYSPVKGWTNACDLRAGDILVTVNGDFIVVEQIQHEILASSETTYNFEVADFHTYYVGDTQVLVHNSCNHTSSWNAERQNCWKNASQNAVPGKDYGSYIATDDNIARMTKGLAPKGWDGYSVQLHHWNEIANDFYNYSPVSRTVHQIIHSLR